MARHPSLGQSDWLEGLVHSDRGLARETALRSCRASSSAHGQSLRRKRRKPRRPTHVKYVDGLRVDEFLGARSAPTSNQLQDCAGIVSLRGGGQLRVPPSRGLHSLVEALRSVISANNLRVADVIQVQLDHIPIDLSGIARQR